MLSSSLLSCCRVRQISKWDNFLMLRDIDLIFCMHFHQSAFQRKIFQKSDDANWPNQPTSRNSNKWDNFYKNRPIWLKFGMQVSFTI